MHKTHLYVLMHLQARVLQYDMRVPVCSRAWGLSGVIGQLLKVRCGMHSELQSPHHGCILWSVREGGPSLSAC